jgi:hypothetical protein
VPPEYVVIYDVRDQGLGLVRTFVSLAWLAGLLAGGGVLVGRIRRRDGCASAFLVLWLALWTGIGGLGIGNVVWQQVKCLNWAKSGAFEIVEGEVRDFQTPPPGKRTPESFTVSGVRFSYSDADLSQGGYNRESGDDGPIREGLHVRISHHDGRILKIEVRK